MSPGSSDGIRCDAGGRHGVQRLGGARPQRHAAQRGACCALMQCQHEGVRAGAPQVQHGVAARGDLQVPYTCIEIFGPREVGHVQGHAAQALDPR